jgi:hypothetical protein
MTAPDGTTELSNLLRHRTLCDGRPTRVIPAGADRQFNLNKADMVGRSCQGTRIQLPAIRGMADAIHNWGRTSGGERL